MAKNSDVQVLPPRGHRELALLGRVSAVVALLCVTLWTVSLWHLLASPEYNGQAVDVDFTVFWAAAKLALGVGWLAPFDDVLLNGARGLPPDAVDFGMIWAYPPGFLVLLLPFGFMPFLWAWLAFCGMSVLALAVALGRPAAGVPGAQLLVLASPACLFTLALGQNSLLTAALLVGTLEAVRRREAVLAGCLIACMTLKPQLGLLIPVVLVAGAYWRVILWAVIGSVAVAATTTAIVGLNYWVSFLDAAGRLGTLVGEGQFERVIVISGYGSATALGLGHALTFQAIVTAAVAISLFWLWTQERVAFDLKAAALCFGVLLASPYAMYYEFVFAVLGAFYLLRSGFGRTRPTALLLVGIWFAPALGFALLPWPGFASLFPLVLTGYAVCLWRATRLASPALAPG